MLLLTFNTIHGYTTSKSLNPWFRHFQIQSDEWIKSQYTHTYIHTDSEFTIVDQNSRKDFFFSFLWNQMCSASAYILNHGKGDLI